jgi:hypothetical protein
MKAEYITLDDAAREIVWLRSLLSSLIVLQKFPTVIYEDNQPAIDLTKNLGDHRRSKHIEVRYHYIREKVDDETVSICHCSSHVQMADFLTKTSKAEQFIATHEAILHSF